MCAKRLTFRLCSKFRSDRVCRISTSERNSDLQEKSYGAIFGSLFCSVLLLAGWSATGANAQDAIAQAHVAAARAAAYEPGQDFTAIFSICAKPDPNPPAAAPAPAAAAPAEPTIPPRSEWYRDPQKVFDNVYHVGGANNEAIWAVTSSEGIS